MQTTVKWCDTIKPRVLWEYTGMGRCYQSFLQIVNVQVKYSGTISAKNRETIPVKGRKCANIYMAKA